MKILLYICKTICMSWKLHFSKLAWKVSYSVKNWPAVFALHGLLYELLMKFSYSSHGSSMDFIPWNPSSCSFHTLGSFHPPQYPAFKMTTPKTIFFTMFVFYCLGLFILLICFLLTAFSFTITSFTSFSFNFFRRFSKHKTAK